MAWICFFIKIKILSEKVEVFGNIVTLCVRARRETISKFYIMVVVPAFLYGLERCILTDR